MSVDVRTVPTALSSVAGPWRAHRPNRCDVEVAELLGGSVSTTRREGPC